MKFTYDAYIKLINNIRENNYVIVDYNNYSAFNENGFICILRHDIDFSIEKAYKLALLENKYNIYSTWFVMVNTNFYNPFSCDNLKLLKEIIEMGGKIGLHFDETAYKSDDISLLLEMAERERLCLERMLDTQINFISMHRPSDISVCGEWQFEKMINTYSSIFTHDFKYLSDSRRRWREPVCDILNSHKYSKLQILTHPFWYNDTEMDLKSSILQYINAGKEYRWDHMNSNFTNLKDVVPKEEITG